MELYKKPVATSHDYGWWIKDGGHAPNWAHTDRHAIVNSEMTRYIYMIYNCTCMTCTHMQVCE